MEIIVAPFDKLDPAVAYDLWRLRQDVFVVEQDCPYPDLDGRDLEPTTAHVVLLGPVDDADRRLPGAAGDAGRPVLGTARVLDDGDVWRIGRVCLDRAARGQGLADDVMRAGLAHIDAVGDGRDAVLDAQAPLAGWYATFGFTRDGEDFLEDGIPHTPMRLRRPEPARHRVTRAGAG
ncbi:GNAT family N-acetyltransferase [Myceligenerans pegani]|uniref:GNAT family N-acetyltransferase n=1 Tax=Myceligenerans pegani TaxID=2776917 RepID=A0ABR9MSM3_9MICO|nr:GNAT family N-acetyltransferase [Myceligenerans sp. TRM 65318]MBE1874366.1 GNAT family N-acetyltransferase [Myceligenerans sp. TRM 65318]MBE3016637.1 GNAT family N-acetyltransferase [Myceligenerans sp. TRM 65318]